MANNCGNLKLTQREGKPDVFVGEINIAGISGRICLVPRKKMGKTSPDFTVQIQQNGGWFEMGAAWFKDMHAGGRFFSITIDGPQLQQPVYVSAFPDDEDPIVFRIVWQRPRKGGSGSAPEIVPSQDLDDLPV
jgi:uncharacterized protein (DUF736 family)